MTSKKDVSIYASRPHHVNTQLKTCRLLTAEPQLLAGGTDRFFSHLVIRTGSRTQGGISSPIAQRRVHKSLKEHSWTSNESLYPGDMNAHGEGKISLQLSNCQDLFVQQRAGAGGDSGTAETHTDSAPSFVRHGAM